MDPLEQTDQCRTCGAPIAWATTRAGARMPLDLRPVDAGNVQVQRDLFGELRALVLGRPAVGLAYRSHFFTCPHSHLHRRTR